MVNEVEKSVRSSNKKHETGFVSSSSNGLTTFQQYGLTINLPCHWLKSESTC